MDKAQFNSYIWSIPLEEVVPYGAYITQIFVVVLSTTAMTNANKYSWTSD